MQPCTSGIDLQPSAFFDDGRSIYTFGSATQMRCGISSSFDLGKTTTHPKISAQRRMTGNDQITHAYSPEKSQRIGKFNRAANRLISARCG